LPAAAGVLLADTLYIVLSVTGLSAVLAASYELFTLLKWAGVIYLIYLGGRLIWSALVGAASSGPEGTVQGSHRSFLGGFALHAANPKALLYFGSLVPQFVTPSQPIAPQLSALALIHLATAAGVLTLYAMISSRLRHAGVSTGANRAFRAAAGSSLIGAGLTMALLRKGAE
jgi:threonine/homoserine/homoserine lactone efflux protein